MKVEVTSINIICLIEKCSLFPLILYYLENVIADNLKPNLYTVML